MINLLTLAPFEDTYGVLAPIVQRILNGKLNKTQRVVALSSLPKAELLEKAKSNFEDAFFILQNETLIKQFTHAELIDIFHAQKVLIQEIVKTKAVNQYLKNEDLMAISHPDLVSAKYLFVAMGSFLSPFPQKDHLKYRLMLAQTHEAIAHDVLNESAFDLKRDHLIKLAKNRPAIKVRILSSDLAEKLSESDKANLGRDFSQSEVVQSAKEEALPAQFSYAFSQHLQELESAALIIGLLEEANPSEEQRKVLLDVKHIHTVVFEKLNDEQLAKLEALLLGNPDKNLKDFVHNIIYTRNIRKEALNILEKAMMREGNAKNLPLAALIPHVIDYCHRTSNQKERFVFSEEEVEALMRRAFSANRGRKKSEAPLDTVFNIAQDILLGKPIAVEILRETPDLAWFAEELKKAIQALPPKTTAASYLETIKGLKTPQQKGLSRYFGSGDSDNFKKVMGEGQAHLTPLQYGPLRKNKYTLQLEYVVKTFLKTKEKDNIKIEKKEGNTFIELEGVTFNLSKIIQYANFNHLELDGDFEDLYDSYLKAEGINYNLPYPLSDTKTYSVNETIFQMPRSGMHAINVYTGNYGHSFINAMLRKGPQTLDSRDVMSPLCTAFFASYALNKTNEPYANPVYRCVKGKGLKNTENQSELLAKQGGLTREAFFSTSLASPLQDRSYTHFIYCETKAPYINYLSKCITEREVLIPPSHFQWTHVQEDTGGNKYFIVKPVAALNLLDPEEQKGILDENAGVNDPSPEGNTALHFAVLLQPSLIPELMKKGAVVNSPNSNGVTPFHLVAKTGNEELIGLFLNHQGKLMVKDAKQKTPYDILSGKQLSDDLRRRIEALARIEDPTYFIKPLIQPEPEPVQAMIEDRVFPQITVVADKLPLTSEPILLSSLARELSKKNNITDAEKSGSDNKRQRSKAPRAATAEDNGASGQSYFSLFTQLAWRAYSTVFGESVVPEESGSKKRGINQTSDDDIPTSAGKSQRLAN